MVGERVYRSFWPKALYNLDAEDTANMTVVGQTDHGETVEIQKRAAESDLIVYVNINLVAMDGGHKSVAVGLAGYESLKHHHNVNTMLHSKSYMDPREGHSAINDSVNRMGRLLADNGVKIFQIETTMNAETFPSQLGFLNKREWEWSAKDQGLMAGAEEGQRPRAAARPPRVLPADRGAVQGDRGQRRRGRGRARAHDREPPPPAARRGAGAVRHR